MLTPIRLLADPDALPPSPPSDLAWLRTCGAAGIEKEGKNCERRRGPEKWDDLWCTIPEVKTHGVGKPSGFLTNCVDSHFSGPLPRHKFRPLFLARCTAGTKPREVVRIHLYAFRIALSTY